MSQLDAPTATATASTPAPDLGIDRGVRYRVLGAICTLAIIAYLHRVGFATAAPELKQKLGLSDRQLSYLMGAFMLSYGVVEVPFGMLSDRFGVRTLLCLLVVIWSALTVAIAGVLWLPAALGVGATGAMVYLLVLRVLFGATQGGMFPSVSRMLADWMPVDERGLAQGCVWTSSRVGGALAPLVVVFLFGRLGVGVAAFAAMASVGLMWVAGFWPWFRNTPAEMPGVTAAERARIETGRPPRAAGHGHGHAAPGLWRAMLASRSVWCLCLTYGAIGLTGNFFTTMLPTYLRTHLGFSAPVAGRISAVPLGCGVVACLLGGWASDWIIRRTGSRRWGRRLVGATGLALGATCMAVAAFVRDPVWLGLILGAAFFGNDLAMGPAWAAAADIGERSAGTLGGTMNMVGSFTGALGAILAGHLLDDGRILTLFAVLAASYALGAVLWLGVDVRQTLVAPASDAPAA